VDCHGNTVKNFWKKGHMHNFFKKKINEGLPSGGPHKPQSLSALLHKLITKNA
jgi:hypothetical protein